MCRTILSLTCFMGLAVSAVADVPRIIHYQGKLVSAGGAVEPGPVDLRVRLYDDPINASPVLFDETHAGVVLNRGLFSVLIGSQSGGVPDSAFAGNTVYLGVSVDGAAELSPRIRIAAAPYAGKTRSAEQLVRPNSVDPAVTVEASGDVGIAGRLGVGTTTPDASALVDMSSTNGGLLPPRMTTAQRDAISSPAPGLMIFNTTTNCFNAWTGTTWKQSCFDCDFAAPTVGNNGPICEGSTLDLTATNIAGATYAWTGPNGFTSAQQNPTIPNASPAADGPYSVTATVSGCTSNPVTTLATVGAQPDAPVVANNGPICAGQTLELTATSIPGGAYAWTGPNGFSSGVQNPLIVNATPAAAGAYTLVVTRGACVTAPVMTTAAIVSTPAQPGAISGSSTACVNTTSPYSVAEVPGATSYTWTAPSGASISGQGTTFATITFGSSSGNVTVTASNFCGTSTPSTLAVTVQGGSGGSQTFVYTGSSQSFTVPVCVTSLTLDVYGSQGSGPGGNGGLGGRATATLPVTPGEVLAVLVGGQNGFNGGGAPFASSGVGGGGSDVRQGGAAIVNRVIVAGGGGGGDYEEFQPGGSGGGGSCGSSSGQNYCGGGRGLGWNGYHGLDGGLNGGAAIGCGPHGGAGSGGGFLSGGGGACGNYNGSCRAGTGELGQGGAACSSSGYSSSCGGGGGGGGYYGGGGGASGTCGDGAGGGGSSWTGSLANQSFAAGVRSGNGQVIINW